MSEAANRVVAAALMVVALGALAVLAFDVTLGTDEAGPGSAAGSSQTDPGGEGTPGQTQGSSSTGPSTTQANGSPPDSSTPVSVVDIEQRASQRDELLGRLTSGNEDFLGVLTLNGTDQQLDDFENKIQRAPDLVQISVGFELDGFDPGLMPRLAARNAIPMISWEPWDFRQKLNPADQPKYSLSRILAGDFDAHIDQWATGLAALDQPVLVRLAHEANGTWYPWAATVNGNTPELYIEMWRYVYERVAAAGADNVIWIWSPNVNFDGSAPITPLYPGDDWVDLVGLVGYFGHWPEPPAQLPSFDDVYGSSLAEIATVTDLPVLITETGATERGGMKAAWIEQFLAEVVARKNIVGFVWFDASKEEDWRVDSSPESLAAFVEGIAALN